MKKILLIGLLLFLLFDEGFAQDQSYEIPDITVDVTIQQNGIIHIDEYRTYHFEGSFSWADYKLPKKGFSEIRNIQVSEEDSSYINKNDEEPGTFSVSDLDNSVLIKWFYQALDNNRTFTLSYDLVDAVSVGPDWTEFFWNYIASRREKPTENLDISIQLPQAVSADSLYAWLRTYSDQNSLEKSAGRFTISAENLSTKQSLAVRSVFPTSVFDDMVSVTDPDLTLEWIQNDEAAYIQEQQEKAEQIAYFDSITLQVTILISVISVVIFIALYQKYGKRFSTNALSGRETILIPDSTPPAIIGRLFGNGTSGQHLSATIFDLARRGWFTIHEKKVEKKGFFSSEETHFNVRKSEPQPREALPDWEKMVADHVNSQIDAGYTRFDEIFSEGDFKMSKWFSEWQKKVKAVYDEKNWIDKRSYKGLTFNIIIQFILMSIALVILILGKNPLGLIALFVAVFMMISSIGIVRKTQKGEEKYRQWKAYINGLKNAKEKTIRMEMLDRHFIYATAFHFSVNQIENIVTSTDGGNILTIPWIILILGSNNSPATLAASMKSLASSGTAAFGGVAGGVGASAGSAGGGASGGAG